MGFGNLKEKSFWVLAGSFACCAQRKVPRVQSKVSMETRSRVLVTGSTGHLGSMLVLRLLESGYSVRAAVVNPGPAIFTCITLNLISRTDFVFPSFFSNTFLPFPHRNVSSCL